MRERRKSGAISLRNFYARRFLRIFPLYYAFLLGMLGISLVLKGGHSLGVRHEIAWCFVYLTNWVELSTFLSITWSLSAEEQFYLVWPPIERFLGSRATIALGVLIAASLALQLSHVYLGVMAGLPTILWQTTFLPILFGVALAHALDTARGFALVHRLVGWRGAPIVFLGILLLALSYPGQDISGFPRIGIHLTFAALLASCVVREDHALAAGLRFPLLARIGVVSYGMYILHQPCLHVATAVLKRLGRGGDGVTLFVTTLVLTVAVAEMSYRYFETPMLRFKRRFETAR
jgi:peptidoglycan/LPS O-acetylase OafA/YrhL